MIDYNHSNLISVIIPSYNSENTLISCVESVISNSYKHFEIIIVDDCSTDESWDLSNNIKLKYPDFVRVHQMPKNSGPASARNAGAKISKGQFLFFLDSDACMRGDTLYCFIKSIKDADAVVGIYDYKPLNKGIVQHYKSMLNYYFFSRKGLILYEVFDSSRAGIKSDIFDSIKGFNETLAWGMDYENEEIGYRIFKKYKMVLDPSVRVFHNFPGFIELIKTYFSRVSLWMQIFLQRKKFESGGVTSSETGVASASLLVSLVLLLISILISVESLKIIFITGSVIFFLLYFYGYAGFFLDVSKKKISYLPIFLFLNIFFTIIISFGAAYGALRWIIGRSEVDQV